MDFPNNAALAAVLPSVHKRGAIVAAVCHGPECFIGVDGDDGEPLIKGKTITALSKEEDEMVGNGASHHDGGDGNGVIVMVTVMVTVWCSVI